MTHDTIEQAERDAWFEGAVVYGVIPKRFGEAGLRSVTDRLDDLRDLGVDALWLSPINAAPEGDFGYAVTDYLEIDPSVGTKADLRDLVAGAHVRGIRVLMDVVPNHTSADHPWFLDAQAHGPASPAYDLYDRDAGGNPTHYFDWVHLPNLNYANPAVRRTMLDALAYWVREFDIDGFRVDVAWGIKERAPDIWPIWGRELRAIKPDLLMLAEASARDPYYVVNGFDAAYDWTSELGHWAWEGVWEDASADPSRVASRLRAALTADGAGYPPDSLVFRFLNNNDTGTRFVDAHGPEVTRVAATLLLTLPGIPCVYTGDEIGASYHPYRDPAPVRWDEDRFALRPFYKRLIDLRRRLPTLRSRAWTLLDSAPSDPTLSYLRHAAASDPPALILLHFAKRPADVPVTIPAAFRDQFGDALIDALGGERFTVPTSGGLTVPMPAWGARVLTPVGP